MNENQSELNLICKNRDNSKIIPNIADPCVHCGFCLPTCPSYKILGTEMASPRGRMHLAQAIENNEIELDQTVTSHFDSCLGCFACVTACPSGVRYDQLIESIRPKLNSPNSRTPCQNLFRKALLSILPYPKRLRVLLQTIRFYSGSALQSFIRKRGITNYLGPQISAMESLLPKLKEDFFQDNFPTFNPAFGNKRGRVGLVLGCVQRCFDPDVNQATLLVLQANGFEVMIPKQQGCCGAVTHHQGDLKQTRILAKELVQSFSSELCEKSESTNNESIEAVIVAAAGCGHTMKAYKELLNKEDGFNCPVFDVNEFLDIKGLSQSFKEKLRPLTSQNKYREEKENSNIRITYHDACHMLHGQGISIEPRRLLREVPNSTLNDPSTAGLCCGSAGIYNLVQPQEASELGEIKVNDLIHTNPDIIASANIGCTLQLRKHLQGKIKVLHPIEILAKSAGIHYGPCS